MIAVIASVVFTFNKIVIENDYDIYFNVPCDAEMHSCFDGEEGPYFELYRKAYNAEYCHITGYCEVLECQEGEYGCEKVYCEGEDCL